MSNATLGDLLRKRYVVNFMNELKKLGQTRNEVLESAAGVVRTALDDASNDFDIDAELKEMGWTLPEWVEGQISDNLKEVFNDE